jgi:hypothetical protein
MKINNPIIVFSLILIFVILACNLPGTAVNPGNAIVPINLTDVPGVSTSAPQVGDATATANPSPTVEGPTPTLAIAHSLIPSTSVKAGNLIHDVVSVDTAAENRAPYGDSYNINLFERPFMQDMSYVPDLDIVSYNLSYDEKFYYVSIQLVGTNPNNKIGIQYAVELDLNADGFGDYIIVARPPFNVGWTTDNVQVVQDTNHDTGGLSAEKSDAPFPGDGYDTVIFDGGRGQNDDHDLAWARINAGKLATVQFAFKTALAGSRFMYGVIADGGLKSIADLDYVDRFTAAEAGSPVRSDKNYPLKALYAVDNVCREAQGFTGTGQEPQRCLSKK